MDPHKGQYGGEHFHVIASSSLQLNRRVHIPGMEWDVGPAQPRVKRYQDTVRSITLLKVCHGEKVAFWFHKLRSV